MFSYEVGGLIFENSIGESEITIKEDGTLFYNIKFSGVNVVDINRTPPSETEIPLSDFRDENDLTFTQSEFDAFRTKLGFNPGGSVSQSPLTTSTANIATRDALPSVDTPDGTLIFVIDASADPDIDTGGAMYYRLSGAWVLLEAVTFGYLNIINVPTEESANITKNTTYIVDASGGAVSLTVDTAIVDYFQIIDDGATFTDTNTVTIVFGVDSLLLKLVNASKLLRILKDSAGLVYNVYNSEGIFLQSLTI